MKIFLAGENGKKRIIKEIVDDSILSRSNNGRKSLKRGQDTSPDRGGTGSTNENVPCKPTYNTEIPRRATNGDYPIRGGYV